jgi:hypothetical protein
MIGIYKITSPSSRVYIGQSVNIERRRKSYQKSIGSKQAKLYASIVKYGFSEHIFEVIEECSIEELNTRERHWQDFYNVLSEKGLNCRLTGTKDKSGYISETSISKLSKSLKTLYGTPEGRQGLLKKASNTDYQKRSTKFWMPILQFTEDGKFIREWTSMKEAGNTLQISRGNITSCCKGSYKSAGGFVWRYKVSTIEDRIYVGKVGYEASSESKKKAIIQYSKQGVIIREWSSMKEAGETLKIARESITRCCKEELKSAGGFVWKYKEKEL